MIRKKQLRDDIIGLKERIELLEGSSHVLVSKDLRKTIESQPNYSYNPYQYIHIRVRETLVRLIEYLKLDIEVTPGMEEEITFKKKEEA